MIAPDLCSSAVVLDLAPACHQVLYALSGQIAALAIRHRVPTSFQFRKGEAAGGLMSYGANAFEMFCLAGAYTGRIPKRDKSGDLPVLQSTKFEFVINLRTARALGIEVPPGLLSIADEVIE